MQCGVLCCESGRKSGECCILPAICRTPFSRRPLPSTQYRPSIRMESLVRSAAIFMNTAAAALGLLAALLLITTRTCGTSIHSNQTPINNRLVACVYTCGFSFSANQRTHGMKYFYFKEDCAVDSAFITFFLDFLLDNGFSDLSAQHLAEALSANFQVTKLDLSHNEFCEKGGEYLGQMLAANEGLQKLNLSWNHIRMKGAIALSAGLRVNGMLKVLDLSYNGFGNEGALALGEALRVNSSLLHLNISCNRISNEGVRLICKGLESNETIRVLKLSRNPITVEGAITLLSSISKRPENRIEELDISNVLVNEQFLSLLGSASESRPGLHVLYAGKKGFIPKKRSPRPDPMKVIQDFLDEHRLRLLDFFKNMDKDGSMSIPVSDFCRYMAAAGMALDASQMDSLVQRLDKDQTGTIDYRDLVDSRKKMVKEQRKQQRRRERRERQERQRSERALRSFHNAVRALTPPAAPREFPGSGTSSAHFSVTPCSSWYQEGEPSDEASSLHIQNAGSDDLDAECSYQLHWSSTSQSHSEPETPKRNTPSPHNMK